MQEQVTEINVFRNFWFLKCFDSESFNGVVKKLTSLTDMQPGTMQCVTKYEEYL